MKILLAAIAVLGLFLIRVLLWLPWGTADEAQHPARVRFLRVVGVVVLGLGLLGLWFVMR